MARRWQVYPQQVFGWRRDRRLGTAGPASATPLAFVPMYIEIVYNRQRLHSAIGFRTPAEARASMEGIAMRSAA